MSTEESEPIKTQKNLNEDINVEMAQLYGQISMFDQLTDYNENDEDQQRNNQYCKGEDSLSEEEDDMGEDNYSNDLHECRKRIQVLNEDI